MPIARILAIGDELVLGRTVDSNSTFLARLLGDLGFYVDQVRQSGDDETGIVRAMAALAEGASLVVCTGGLGPTADDRTRHALTRLLQAELVESAPAWRSIKAAWGQLRPGVIVPEINRQQALIPRGTTWLANDRGTAPGILVRGPTTFICLPGVPHEMKAMAERALARRLGITGLVKPAVTEVYFSGIGESTAQERIGDLFTASDPQVGITVNERGHITLRVIGRRSQAEARALELAARLTEHVLPEPGLAPSVVAALNHRAWTIAVAESCTCGHLTAQLGALPGVSAVLRGGVVAYHETVKRQVLGVPAPMLRRHGAVSAAVVASMAEGVRKLFATDLALATSGVAGPDGGSPEKPVGLVWLACATTAGTVTRSVRIAGSRERVQARAASAALQLAWDVLNGRTAPENAAH